MFLWPSGMYQGFLPTVSPCSNLKPLVPPQHNKNPTMTTFMAQL